MKTKTGPYIAIVFLVLVYSYAILERAMGWTDYTVASILRNNSIFIFLVLFIVYLINSKLLKKGFEVFFLRKESFVIYLVTGLLLLSIDYVINSIGRLTYFQWFPRSTDLPIHDTLREILGNKLYTFFLLGPFIWLTESFGVITRVFLLNNFWTIKKSKLWIWATIIFVALLFSLLQLDKGPAEIMNTFLIIIASNIFYYKFRNCVPLLIAPILYTTIDLIAFWIYNY